ncbi:MAG: hypothetical protein JWQ09_2130 [Segetibacter sp.]|nr:hypothetical protein [Segetibacter sp.]
MSNTQFAVLYNGHPVTVTVLDNDTYMIQVTYKPVTIRLQNNNAGEDHWVDVEMQQETYLSRELGKLIVAHLCAI